MKSQFPVSRWLKEKLLCEFCGEFVRGNTHGNIRALFVALHVGAIAANTQHRVRSLNGHGRNSAGIDCTQVLGQRLNTVKMSLGHFATAPECIKLLNSIGFS